MVRLVKADLDGHLRTSSFMSSRYAYRVIDKAQERLGNGGIVGILRYDSPTEIDPRWNNFFGKLYKDMITTSNGRYLPKEDLLFVHGQEVKTHEGYELLVIGSPENSTVPHRLPGKETVRRAKDLGAYVVLAAPFHNNGMCTSPEIYDDEVMKNINAIETFSGEAEASFGKYEDANRRAEEFFRIVKHDFPDIARFVGTDNHSIRELGKTHSTLAMPDDYTKYHHAPEKLVRDLYSGLSTASSSQNFVKKPAKIGAYMHAIDIITLMGLKKAFGWDPNKFSAPLLEAFGICV